MTYEGDGTHGARRPEHTPLFIPAARPPDSPTERFSAPPEGVCGILCHEVPGPALEAFFALRLDAAHALDQEERVSAQALLLSRLRYALDGFPGVSHAIEVRFIVQPLADPPALAAAGITEQVTCCVIGRVTDWRRDAEAVTQRATALSHEIGQLLSATMDAYRFAAVADPAGVAALLDPFPIADVLEIRPKLGPDGALPEIYGGLPDGDALVDVMTRQAAPTVLTVSVELIEPEAALRTLTIAPEHTDHSPATSWTEAADARTETSLLPELEAELTRRRWQALRLAAYSRHIFRMRVQLASAAPLGEALVGSTVGEIGGPSRLLARGAWRSPGTSIAGSAVAVRPHTARATKADTERESDIAIENARRLGFRPWGEGGQSAANFVDLGEAARLFPLPTRARWLSDHQAPLALPFRERVNEGQRLGVNHALGGVRPVLLPAESRAHHVWIVGQTGTGKSMLIESLILQDIAAGKGVIVLDPHGELIDNVLLKIPARRADDVIFFNPADLQFPIGINILEASSIEERAMVVSAFNGLMRKLYDPHTLGIVGPRFEHAARNGLLTVMSQPEGGTLVEVMRVMTDDRYMRTLLPNVTDPIVRRYWEDQIANTNDFHRSEVLDWIVSKFGPFVTDYTLRGIIGQPRSGFRFREAMDSGKIVLMSLAKGRLGGDKANFLGLILLPMILQAALSRTDQRPEERRECALYIDEFQNYATESLALMLAEARKYKLGLILANQHVGQLTNDIRDAVIGNVGSLVSFRLGMADAVLMEHILAPSPISASHLLNLPNFTAYVRLLIDRTRSDAFNLETERVTVAEDPAQRDAIISHSQRTFGRPRAVVDAEMDERAKLTRRPPPQRPANFSAEALRIFQAKPSEEDADETP